MCYSQQQIGLITFGIIYIKDIIILLLSYTHRHYIHYWTSSSSADLTSDTNGTFLLDPVGLSY